MNCVETKKYIEELVDGELFGKTKEAVDAHLKACRACRIAKEDLILLSGFLRTSEIEPPADSLEERVYESFRRHRKPKPSVAALFGIFFGVLAIPKPIFAALLFLTAAGMWTAFQVGKINSSVVTLSAPTIISNEHSARTPPEIETKTVIVEVPVVKEKIVTRTVYVRQPSVIQSVKSKTTAPPAVKSNVLPSYSSVAENGYFTDVDLHGFVPSTEMSAKIIKGEKKDEK